jgi:hypothetical protein
MFSSWEKGLVLLERNDRGKRSRMLVGYTGGCIQTLFILFYDPIKGERYLSIFSLESYYAVPSCTSVFLYPRNIHKYTQKPNKVSFDLVIIISVHTTCNENIAVIDIFIAVTIIRVVNLCSRNLQQLLMGAGSPDSISRKKRAGWAF